MSSQGRFWIVVATVAVVCGVSIRAATNWASAPALGDVAVSFDNHVTLFDNANDPLVTDYPEDIDTTDVPNLSGSNGGLAFDASLKLIVANTTNNRLVKLAPDSHIQTGSPITTTAPRSLAIAADGTIYVATTGSPTTTIQRIGAATTPFTVPTDSATCIGIDLSPEETLPPDIVNTVKTQEVLYYVSGGRTIRTLTVTKTKNISTLAETFAFSLGTLTNPLPGTGTACGIRLLAPVDARTVPTPVLPTPLVGGMIVADSKDVKLVTSSGVTSFDAGAGSKNWIDVAVDPDAGASPTVLDFWGVNAGSQPTAVKFRVGGPNPRLTIALTGGHAARAGHQR